MARDKTLSWDKTVAANIDLSLYAVSWRIQAWVIARHRSQDVHLQLRAEQNGSERRGKFTWRFVPLLAQLTYIVWKRSTRKLVKYMVRRTALT